MDTVYCPREWAGHDVRVYCLVDSTNAVLKRLAREGAAHGVVIVADEQTDGRGRMERKWVARRGSSALFSLLVRPSGERVPAQDASQLVFLCALGMARAVRAVSGVDARVKWPNDLVAGGKKLSGMMCEMQADGCALDWAVLGIGVNILDADARAVLPDATSIMRECGRAVDRDALIERFLREFDSLYAVWRSSGLKPILAALEPLSATLNRFVRALDAEGKLICEGVAEFIAPDGALCIRSPGGEIITLRAGDVSVRGETGYS